MDNKKKLAILLQDINIDKIVERFRDEISDSIFLRIIIDTDSEVQVIQAVFNAILNLDD